ncbi:hypothetical protein BH10PSE7_BH10PSE7_27870 [soil metagenome]
MSDGPSYFVTRPDEMSTGFGRPGSPIPTLGSPASAFDQYRTIALHKSDMREGGVAFTDVGAVVALAKIAEGGLTSIHDLNSAEVSLQALLLHEQVFVLIAAPKVNLGAVTSYLRPDGQRRTQYGFELTRIADSIDWLVAPEFLEAVDGTVTSSSAKNSTVVGTSTDDIRTTYVNSLATEGLNVAIEMHEVPAYLTEPQLVYSRRGDGFAKRFYNRLNISWKDAVGEVPPMICTFSLPPLLAIVLHRMHSRGDLLQILTELRAELAGVRKELRDFNSEISSSTTQADVESRSRYISEAFASIVAESRLSPAQLWRRRFFSLQRVVRPIIKFGAGFLMGSGTAYSTILEAADGIRANVEESSVLVDRTLTSTVFSKLLRETEAIQALVKHHFSKSEIDAIERSTRG